MASVLQEPKSLTAGLLDALKALEEGQTEEAVSGVTSIKQEAAAASEELVQAQQILCQLKDFYTCQREFLSHHIKVQEKKERELAISKSISESIQRSQHKKLQACKWELMKARNALFIAQKKVRRQEKELILNEFHMHSISPFWEEDNDSLEDLTAIAKKTESAVRKLETGCTVLENASTDTLKKIAEFKNKLEHASQDSKCLKEIRSTREQYVQQTRKVEGYMKQAVSLWTLCQKAFDNGCKREDVLNAIARQAKETTGTLHLSDASQSSVIQSYSRLESRSVIEGAIDMLEFNPQCLMCGEHRQPVTSLKCGHCLSRKYDDVLASQKVVVESFMCTNKGTISGTLWVVNIAYDKQVLIRYSQNSWLSSAEVVASYESSCSDFDIFKFELPFTVSASLCLEFAVQYKVAGAEHWDNNGGRNYRIFF